MNISAIAASIKPLDVGAKESAKARQDSLTKPQGALGRLEDLSIQLAGIYRTPRPKIGRKVIFVMAADHGITAEGVSAYPSEVTAQMVLNFTSGGAAINVLARHAGAEVVVVDMGVKSELSWPEIVRNRKVGMGTRNMAQDRSMTREECDTALLHGAELAIDEARKGATIVAIGDMGIGNTSSATALASIFTGTPVSAITGRGTGLNDEGLTKKIKIIQEVINLHRPDPKDPVDVLGCVGGFEIAGMAGVILGAASKGIPVVLDGFISSSSALVAAAMAPESKSYMIASHKSVERGHEAILKHLGLEPLFDLRMRLGEGTGAALAMGIIEASCKILDEMATFEGANVSKKKDGE